MGLLDFDNADARLGLGLLAAASARSDGAGVGQRLMEGVNSVDQWKQMQQMNAMRQAQIAHAQLQMKQSEQQINDLQDLRELAKQYQTHNGFDRAGFANALEAKDPIKGIAYQQSIQKDESPIAVKEGEVLLDRKTKQPLFTNVKPEKDPTAIQEYKFAQNQGYTGTFQQFVLEQKRAGATSIVNKMDNGFGEAFAKDAASNLAASRDVAKAAVNNINTLNRIDEVIAGGKVAVGPTAKFEQFGRQLGAALGVGGKDNSEVLANTRKMMQSSAQLAADGASMLAKQGAITDAERALVARAAGGDIDSMTVPEIQAMSAVLKKINSTKIDAHKAMLQNVDKKFSAFVPFYQVDAPSVSQQPSNEPNVVHWGALK